MKPEEQLNLFALAEKGAKIVEKQVIDPNVKMLETIQAHLKMPMCLIDIEPMATPRPRFTQMWKKYGHLFGRVLNNDLFNELKKLTWTNTYHPTEYTKYKESLRVVVESRIRSGELKAGEYSTIVATFFFTYPKSTPKKYLIDNASMEVKPDCDNTFKGLMDGMSEAFLIEGGDSRISSALIMKRYTLSPEGFITFTLG